MDVRVDPQPGGTTAVQVTVERPETLQLLLHDQSQLQHALSQAGVASEGHLTFHLASTQPDGDATGAQTAQTGQDGAGHSAAGQSGANGGNGQGQRAGNGSAPQGAPDGFAAVDPFAPPARVLRAGIDILA